MTNVMTHVLKTWPDAFEQVRTGVKQLEWRKDDRGFKVGDMLELVEYDPDRGTFSGRSIVARVTCVLRGKFDIPDGFCVMSIFPVRHENCGVIEWRRDEDGDL